MKRNRNPLDDLRGASRLVIDATKGVTSVVEAMHRTIAGGPNLLGRPLEGPTRLVTGAVYGSIRGVTELVGSGLELALASLAPLLGDGTTTGSPERWALLAALNGVLGDHLRDTGNPLAIDMRFCLGGHPLDLTPSALRVSLESRAESFVERPEARKLLVLLHGCCMNDQQWDRQGHDHGAALAKDLGYTPVYLRYNSGLHISTSGRTFAGLLERLVGNWPVPVDAITLVGHSMGGLVSRSACHIAEEEALTWRKKLCALVCLGSPHHGAPLERGGSWVDLLLRISRYSAPLAQLGRIRSAGVTDMRFGIVQDEHWDGVDRFAIGSDPRRQLTLPEGVACFAVAGTLSSPPRSEPGEGASFATTKRLRSDGLVPVASALGEHVRPELTLAFPEAHRWVAPGVHHLDLLSSAEVYETLRTWLARVSAPRR